MCCSRCSACSVTGEGAYPFFALGTTVIMMAGYDRMTGAAAVLLGSCCGFACGMLNLFTTGVSQQIVGLPMFSGIGYRAVVLAVFFGIGLVFILHYAHKIRKGPHKEPRLRRIQRPGRAECAG